MQHVGKSAKPVATSSATSIVPPTSIMTIPGIDHGSGSGVAEPARLKRQKPASPRSAGIVAQALSSDDGGGKTPETIGAKRMRNVDIGPAPEVPKFADGPDLDTAAQLAAATDAKANTAAKVEELRGQCRQAFDVHATALDANAGRMTKIELELVKWSRVACDAARCHRGC